MIREEKLFKEIKALKKEIERIESFDKDTHIKTVRTMVTKENWEAARSVIKADLNASAQVLREELRMLLGEDDD